MHGPWWPLSLILILTSVPRGHAQQEAAMEAEGPGLDLLRQAERLLLLREDLQGLPGAPIEHESQLSQPDWLSKRQHPGKREEDTEERPQEEEEEVGTVGLHKRQHPGRRSPWLEYPVTKRQHPGRRLVDPLSQRSWEEDVEEDREGAPLPEKRQHPGKRAPGGLCGPWGACGQASLLLGLLDDLSRGQGAQEKRQHPGRRASWAREPLEA
ncbi:PREDICTED: thyrotropin releasing hormone [Chinchilla lanigera]|uniref:thyrotropin releasing hormone n=1 Tax=Chinchilla lanigera TaxID=34839 RepID=UPI00038EA39F|nr:PREDICTED: thyrotropin releasing hormone [Chinchilla lanigera]XP_013370819.1 PREDICTED: thyrotropin releasing hormone [Chinchilla lanigera]